MNDRILQIPAPLFPLPFDHAFVREIYIPFLMQYQWWLQGAWDTFQLSIDILTLTDNWYFPTCVTHHERHVRARPTVPTTLRFITSQKNMAVADIHITYLLWSILTGFEMSTTSPPPPTTETSSITPNMLTLNRLLQHLELFFTTF